MKERGNTSCKDDLMAYALYILILFGLKPRTIELQSAINTIAAIIVQFRHKVHMQILTDFEEMCCCVVIAGTDRVYNTYMHGCCTILYNSHVLRWRFSLTQICTLSIKLKLSL